MKLTASVLAFFIDELRSGEFDQTLSNSIDSLSDLERIEVREACIAAGLKDLPRNLYYNYTTQKWIMTAAERARANAEADKIMAAMARPMPHKASRRT